MGEIKLIPVCEECDCELIEREIERGEKKDFYICEQCDDVCRCRLCEVNN